MDKVAEPDRIPVLPSGDEDGGMSDRPDETAGEASSARTTDDAPAGRIDYSKEENLLALVQTMVKSASSPLPEAEKADDYSSAGQEEEKESRLERLAPLPADGELHKLRELILGREIDGLDMIYRHLSDSQGQAEAVSSIITEALLLRIGRDNKLDTVLKPTVDNIVRASVRHNPYDLAENLFPVIGPAIRRSISESLKGVLLDLSRTLEISLSLRGLKWRLESLRTGRKFSELVLLKNLEYQVEEIYFVHTESGAILDHLIRDGVIGQDADQVAAMFTAIQQFVNDSFAEGNLSNIEFGEVEVLLASSPRAYLACVVRGHRPGHLRSDLQAALELMVMECADELDNFTGDTAHFRKARRHMEGLLTARFKDDNRSLPLWAKLLPLTVVVAMLVGPVILGYKYYQMTNLARVVTAAASGPGLVPVRVNPSLFGQWDIACFRDDLATGPEGRIVAVGLPRERFNITYMPYISQDYTIIKKRVDNLMADRPERATVELSRGGRRTAYIQGEAPVTWVLTAYERLLAVPGVQKVEVNRLIDQESGVTFWFDAANVLHLEGQASAGWREMIREKVMNYSAVAGIDMTRLAEDPATVELTALRNKVNQVTIHFPSGGAQPVPEDVPLLTLAVDDLVVMEKLADTMGLAVALTIFGHADATGSDKRNYELSQERAKTMAAMLYARGSSIPIYTYGMGSGFAEPGESQAQASSQASRKIELRVDINRKPITLDFVQPD